MASNETAEIKSNQFRRFIAKFGFGGAFAFFTIKGLLYLLIPAALAYFSCS
jgi:hypothetical protein